MKVAIVCRGLPNSQNLMNGIFELDQAKALVAAGVDVKMLVVDLRSIRRWRHWGLSHEIKDGVDCYIVSVPVGNVSYLPFCAIGATALKSLYHYAYGAGDQPDIIHAHFTRQGHMAAKLSQKTGIPLVITEHNSEMNLEHIDDTLLKIANEAYKTAKTVIAVSRPLQTSIKLKTGIESTVIPNVVDTSLFATDESKRIHEMFTFVSVGGLIQRKRMDLLVDAFAIVHKKYSGTNLIIFGRGEEETSLREKVRSYGLDDYVDFRGLVKREKIAEEYKKADAFVLLSERETFGVAYIEALASGLPVVATRCQGPEDYMRDEFGYLIDVGNLNQAVEAMEGIYQRKNEFSATQISKAIKTMYAPNEIAKRLVGVYNGIYHESISEN